MSSLPDNSITVFYDEHNERAGLGFLVAGNYVFTCAHVVCRALALDPHTQEQPFETVKLCFEWVDHLGELAARVIAWIPMERGSLRGDIALLEVSSPFPEGVTPAGLLRINPGDYEFKAFGFPPDNEVGTRITCRVEGKVPNQQYLVRVHDQRDGEPTREYGLSPGFSGTPAWTEQGNIRGVLGIISSYDENTGRDGYMIPSEQLAEIWTPLFLPELIDVYDEYEFYIETDNGEFLQERVKPYSISKYPITTSQYRLFVQATNRAWEGDLGPQYDDFPATYVTLEDAREFCEWLSMLTSKRFRLPYEDEWVKAARGPASPALNDFPKREFPWGPELPDPERCVMDRREVSYFGSPGFLEAGTRPKGDSFYGCSDMAGNVSEWCLVRSSAKYAALRGGNWTETPAEMGIANRYLVELGAKFHPSSVFGFRVVRVPD